MKKFTALTLCFCLIAMATIAQQFDPAPSPLQTKLEKFIGRLGTPERIYLNDVKKKTFEAKADEVYGVIFLYNVNTKTKRRMMVYELGSNGEKLNPKYPDFSKGYRGEGSTQGFVVRLDKKSSNTTYKIDADQAATVYIYRLIPGVK